MKNTEYIELYLKKIARVYKKDNKRHLYNITTDGLNFNDNSFTISELLESSSEIISKLKEEVYELKYIRDIINLSKKGDN